MKIETILVQIDLGSLVLPEFRHGYVWHRDWRTGDDLSKRVLCQLSRLACHPIRSKALPHEIGHSNRRVNTVADNFTFLTQETKREVSIPANFNPEYEKQTPGAIKSREDAASQAGGRDLGGRGAGD